MLKEAMQALRSAERPVIIYGAGVRLADATHEARELARMLGVPVAVTWAARDVFPADDETVVCVGGFGTHGTRAANFAVQNADWILSIGSRLDSKATGTPREYFARAAQVFMVDIDPTEIAKFKNKLGREFSGAQADAKLFLAGALYIAQNEGPWPEFHAWRVQCREWLIKYPVLPNGCENTWEVNPYAFVHQLSQACQPGEIIVSDTGLSLAWMMQAFDFKEGQRFLHAFNQTPMGYGLPAAVGAAFAQPGRRVVLVNGDGAFMLNIQELAVIAKHNLPIKIVLMNNGGHAMCRQTQEQWLGGNYYSTDVEHGLSFPDFVRVAYAFDIPAGRIDLSAEVPRALEAFFRAPGPGLLDVVIGSDERLNAQVQYGKPNEDGNPPLPREELAEQMIVGVLDD